MALVGHVDAISRGSVAGWAVDPDTPDAPARVAVIVNGQQRGSAVADQPRPGLAASSKGVANDAAAFRYEFEPPLSVFREWRIEVVQVGTHAPLSGGVHTLAKPSRDGGDTLAPLLVTAIGRSGTTLMMSEFARHPKIVVAERHPFEIKQIAYYASVFRTVAAAADRVRSVHPDAMLSPERIHAAGSNPFNAPGFYDLAKPRALMQSFYENRVPSQYAQLFRSLILEFYDILRVSQGKAAAPFFAEKGNLEDEARHAARLFFPQVKEVLIARDPRDLLASSMSFWKLPPERAFGMLRSTVAQLLAIHRVQWPDTIAVRYEDLILDPLSSRRTIGEFVGLDLHLAPAAADSAAMTQHRTSSDPVASIGRWRQDLTEEQIAACDAAFKTYMEAFDYRPAATWEPPRPAPQPATSAPARAAPAAAAPPKPASPVAAQAAPAPPPAAAAPARRPATAGGLFLAAEGNAAVAQLRAAGTDTSADGRPMQPIARLEFGRGNAGAAQLGPGWSRPEPGYVWSNANQCHFALPPLREPGLYRVWIAGAPMLHPEKLPEQSVTLLVNGKEIGTVALRALSVLAFDLPGPTAAVGGKIAVTLQLPNAARPKDFGVGTDDRLLGFSLRWATVLRAA